MFDQFIGTKPVEERHRLDVPRLEAYLRERIEGFRGPLEIEQFKGGQSNPTVPAERGGKRYALRRKPPGKLLPSAHAVDREYRVIKALHSVGFPGRAALRAVRGRWRHRHDVLRHGLRRRARAVGPVAARHAASRTARAMWDEMNRVIALLHTIDYRALGSRISGARQLHRAPDRALDQAIPGVRARENRGDGQPDRLAAEEHSRGRRIDDRAR
jgi:aminoglycoside phosphotransferase (APT) family kinase protein